MQIGQPAITLTVNILEESNKMDIVPIILFIVVFIALWIGYKRRK